MAEDLDDGEFWLPSQFLAEDEKTDFRRFDTKPSSGFSFPYGFDSSVQSTSALSSPVESAFGSSETESDEEDYLTELTKQIAHSTLEDCMKATPPAFPSENKGWGSPQSTLCGCKQSLSRGSINGLPQLSPPSSPFESNDFNWDLLYAAVGEVARIRMNEEGFRFQNSGLLGQHKKQNPISPQQLKANQFQQLKQQQQLLKQQQNGVVWGGAHVKANGGLYSQQQMVQNSCGGVRPLGMSQSAWPSLQQTQNSASGSGMRAVFLGAPKRESTGTGVFLPRRVHNNQAEPRKKTSCSTTVLLPARVVQALNLDLDGMSAQPHLNSHLNGSYSLDTEAMKFRNSNNYGFSQQRRNYPPAKALLNLNHHEIRLPQEWTY